MTARNRTTHHLVLAALFTAMTAVCAQIQIPLPAVPVSLALLAVHLCGALLPPRFSALAMFAYALLGCLGVPVYSGFAAGPSILFGPTGGYILGFVLSAPVTGLLIRRLGTSPRSLYLSMAAGFAVCCAFGTGWFMAVTGTPLAAGLTACVLPFLPGDVMKIALAALLARRLRKIC